MKRVNLLLASVSFSVIVFGAVAPAPAGDEPPVTEVTSDATAAAEDHPFIADEVWKDGLTEISYFDMKERVQRQVRNFTQVQLLERQMIDPWTGVQAGREAKNKTEMLVLNIGEEIPLRNYDQRHQTSVYLNVPNLDPVRMTISSHEWPGSTFKHLRWSPEDVLITSCSYHADEGDRTWRTRHDAVPFEALFVMVRDIVSGGPSGEFSVMGPMRSTHQVDPRSWRARFSLGEPKEVTVKAGTFLARKAAMEWRGPATFFMVEAESPYRILRFEAGLAFGELVHYERRAYQKTSSSSEYYEPFKAP